MIRGISRFFSAGYQTLRADTVDGPRGGRHREYAPHLQNVSGHLQERMGNLVYSTGTDIPMQDAVFYCALGTDIEEHDRLIDLQNKKWDVTATQDLRRPRKHDGFMQVSLEKIK